MVRIAPVRLAFNPRTLWFDACSFDLNVGQAVVVTTARGLEFGRLSHPVFEMAEEETKKLKSPLKAVKRIATDEDIAQQEELAQKSIDALPIFKEMAAESLEGMNPVAVEYLFDGEKAVFYFESEDRVDFRDLVRKLAARFHVRVDMKQIGVRDEARMIGGLGHCGQELCCARLGGEFNPVSIRMAKEQDLSLNPQKISGTCGRLMCCLRYEYDAYKDFHARAPKKNAKIQTPDGEGKVVDLDVPREIISIQIGTEKPVKVPLADMDPASEEGARPNSVGAEAWEKAHTIIGLGSIDASSLFSVELSGEDKLAEPGQVRHVHNEDDKASAKSRSGKRSGSASKRDQASPSAEKGDGSETTSHKPRRRRSTTVKSDGTSKVTQRADRQPEEQKNAAGKQSKPGQDQAAAQDAKPSRRRRRSRNKTSDAAGAQGKSSQVGRNSSALRAARQAAGDASGGSAIGQSAPQKTDGSQAAAGKPQARRRRRRSHRASSEGTSATGQSE